jgi:hypothetical protein
LVQDQPEQKVHETHHLNQWLDTLARTCHFSYARKPKETDCGPSQPKHKARPYLKNNQSKKGWWCSSSGRELGPEFNFLVPPKKIELALTNIHWLYQHNLNHTPTA